MPQCRVPCSHLLAPLFAHLVSRLPLVPLYTSHPGNARRLPQRVSCSLRTVRAAPPRTLPTSVHTWINCAARARRCSSHKHRRLRRTATKGAKSPLGHGWITRYPRALLTRRSRVTPRRSNDCQRHVRPRSVASVEIPAIPVVSKPSLVSFSAKGGH